MNRRLLILIGIAFLAISCTTNSDSKNETPENLPPKLAKLKLQPGFKAEHLYSPGDEEEGSWVAMTFDNKGRLITSDQYGALYRMEIPAIGSENLTPKIEKLKIQTGEQVADSVIQMGYAQGLLYAFNSLYVMVNHRSDDEFEKGSGLYRLQDTDNDDQYDKITLLKELDGAGEHGPHSIVMAPDQKSLYVIAGNHTDMPEMDSYRLPKVWEDDNLFPLIKDPRGHANDRGAPGGWIAHIDPEGKKWEQVASGFRNPFDLAFNELGDMFTYDSDMEWDLGMPWYRPTRICHVPSGAEFGWRTGNQKWSAAYPDNLPPVLNIGQGSPTSVSYGKDAKFPEKYKHSIFAFDWSFGIIYAIELKPEGATYSGIKEEFVSGIPLPLTDGVIGPDGAMYFMTGGRRLESDLYRVYYKDEEGKEAALASTSAPEQTEENALRKKLETYHMGPIEGAVDFAWPNLKHTDRFVRYAARIAIEHQPVKEWQDRVYSEKDPEAMVQGMIALARHGNASQRDRMLIAMMEVKYDGLSDIQQVDLLRAFEVTISRFGKPASGMSNKVVQYLEGHYPAKTDVLNQSLSKTLAYLDDPKVVSKTLALLQSQEGENASVMANTATDASDLILRNPQYGMDIASTLKNMPLAQHTYYGIVLDSVNAGWTPELRDEYFKWFYKAFSFKAGRSYIGFIDKARESALSQVPKNKFEYYNTISGDSLLGSSGTDLVQEAEQPEGPGRNWQPEDVESLLADGLEGRNFEDGKNMYAAATCVTCHAMRGEGENIGPDLTQLGTRFTPEDMMEAIIEPNKTISDQYNATEFSLKNGQTVVGRLISEDDSNYVISQNPYAPDLTRKIPKSEVTSQKMSTVSLMPAGLINRMNPDELKDLLAYLKAGGNPDNPVYSKGGNQAQASR
ncbi:putative heme-binding domain-containing protein [Pricia antarctica]|uniref:Putative heme-binding domain-containing protein n=1 Tax=Pricia antarctica TaxID=641691 RepID=A0A1G7BZ86_9FLAO|nr:c-type cytochrome [Pricia antarctica]SDE32367.1 putative heme-binding domain-containing protein [Pricia antarctica]